MAEGLMKDDLVEMALRRLASYVYGTRTGDWGGANYMLAVKPPGSEVDIAPDWLTTDATTWSKSEHQRNERVKVASKSKGGKDGKGKKGKDGKGTPAGGAAATQG